MSIAKLQNNTMLVLLFYIIHTVLYNKFIITILLTVEYYILYINLKIAFHAKFDINKINKVFLFFEKIKKFLLYDNVNKLILYKKNFLDLITVYKVIFN